MPDNYPVTVRSGQMDEIPQFPHCDSRVLHAPGKCVYCDLHPEWQELRRHWHINFTGEHYQQDEYGNKYLPCPAEVQRPLGLIERWGGNVPVAEELEPDE